MPVRKIKHSPAAFSPTPAVEPPTTRNIDPPVLKPPPLERVPSLGDPALAEETDASSVSSAGSGRSQDEKSPIFRQKRKRRDSLRKLSEQSAPTRKRRVKNLSPRLIPKHSISSQEAFSRVAEAVRGVHGALFTVDDVAPYILATYPDWLESFRIGAELARIMAQMNSKGRLREVRRGELHVDGHEYPYYRLPTAEELSGSCRTTSAKFGRETVNPFKRVNEAVRGVAAATFTVDDVLPYIRATYPGWKSGKELSHILAHMCTKGLLIAVGTGRPDSDGHNEIIYRLPTTSEKKRARK